jgi:hypothetical protein
VKDNPDQKRHKRSGRMLTLVLPWIESTYRVSSSLLSLLLVRMTQYPFLMVVIRDH